MSCVRVSSIAHVGIEAVCVDVEVDVKAADKLTLIIVGLPDAAVKESKDRVLTAIKNSSFRLDTIAGTVNLAPGDLKKEGPLYDLPIALGLLFSCGLLKASVLNEYFYVGELSLTGDVRAMRGALSAALLAKKMGKRGILLPVANEREASLVPDLQVIGVQNLREAVEFLKNPTFSSVSPPPLVMEVAVGIDFADIKGQTHAKRAALIAAAGGHNLLLYGPPGSGKTLLAKAISGILPPMELQEALEVTKIHSILGYVKEGLMTARPFRAPHHTISAVGLIGGGGNPRPGEISLAHHGVLFLDELPEFPRHTLEVLRQPLENGYVSIARANAKVSFPTICLFVAAMNPCPCGYLGHPQKVCSDTPLQISRYRSKISGPLLDRIDMHVEMPAIPFRDIHTLARAETSADIRKKVVEVRKRQKERKITPLVLNSSCQKVMEHAVDTLGISTRGFHRLLKVARTIADLSDQEEIEEEHLMEALGFRSL